jgi:hypothetical protein
VGRCRRDSMLRLTGLCILVAAATLGDPARTTAAPPVLLHTSGYESPVRGDPDDLVMLGGIGFHATDRVIYRAVDVPLSSATPAALVPRRTNEDEGIAPIVQQGNSPYAITVRLPDTMRKDRAYRLWVVTAGNEWSRPVMINDPRPQWISPSYVYATADFASLGRRIRVVGRNLAAESAPALQIRLTGPSTQVLTANIDATQAPAMRYYVAEAALPTSLAPGTYSISARRAGLGWTELPGQRLEVRPDPPSLPTFTPSDPQYGGCRPDDAADDSQCFARAIAAAARAGGGTVLVPRGTWDLATDGLAPGTADGFILARNVHLRGTGAQSSFIVRHGTSNLRRTDALFTLSGRNMVTGLSFRDAARFELVSQSRPVIQLGTTASRPTPAAGDSDRIEEIVVTDNAFLRVGRAIADDGGYPIARLFITRNEFGAYFEALSLPLDPTRVAEASRLDDSIVRWNRFIPGSYVDLSAHQGTMASEIGAADHVDFSSNVADGTSTEALQDPDDPPGFRAAFFWNMANSVEHLLVAENRVLCSGDKDGDGEAFSFDDSGDTYGLEGAPVVSAAGPDWVAVRGSLAAKQYSHTVPRDTYYKGYWVQVVDGPGLGQTRKIVSYVDDANGSTVVRVTPTWDVVPAPGAARIFVGRQYWQVFVVANEIEHRSPPCHKSNLTGPHGGVIAFWMPSADSAIEANRQYDTSGILFSLNYSVHAPSCPECGAAARFQTALEIRGNVIEGEYDWTSDCSASGISASVGASPTPESPPPILGFGISISHNSISQADGARGGAIDFPILWFPGPPPGNWNVMENLLVFHNRLADLTGSAPRANCGYGQRNRSGIRFQGPDHVRDSVLYANKCERVDVFLDDAGKGTTRLCPSQKSASAGPDDRCECQPH